MFAIVFEGSQKYVVREKNDHLSLVAQTRVMLYKMKLFTLYHFSICFPGISPIYIPKIS